MYGSVNANNIKVDNQPMLLQQDKVNNTVNISFDLSWENSWRVSTAPGNWDAAWIFAKYKMGSSNVWKHCKLSPNVADYNLENNNGINATIKPVSDSVGVYIYRTENGLGSINWDGVNLKWHYGSEPAFEDSIVIVKVYAIEMVYVPQGAFYVGDGNTTSIKGHFCDASNNANPYRITSENSITLGGTVDGNLGNNNATGITAPADDFNNITTATLPATFPKGFNAFYCMKYEITQELFVGFLNSLTRKQQDTIMFGFILTANSFIITNATVQVPNRIAVKTQIKPVSTIVPITFALDLDNDNIYNETVDGASMPLSVSAPYIIDAFADWSGLRMMTELEYEKACRGPSTPILNEAAWGVSSFSAATTLSNLGTETESVTAPSNANSNLKKNLSTYNTNGVTTRVGIFATSSSNREKAGASYYGIMNMSDNVFERVVSVGTVTGRNFIGNNGDGSLSIKGIADVSGWINVVTNTNNGVGFGLRGASFSNAADTYFISTRINANTGKNYIGFGPGGTPHAGRCVRSDN